MYYFVTPDEYFELRYKGKILVFTDRDKAIRFGAILWQYKPDINIPNLQYIIAYRPGAEFKAEDVFLADDFFPFKRDIGFTIINYYTGKEEA